MVVDSRDFSVAPHLITKGEWEFGYTQYFRSLVRPESHILDCGANFGYYGLVSSTENPLGTVTFVEPNPLMVPFLRINSHLSGIENRSKIVDEAVLSEVSSINLNIPDDFWGSARLGDENNVKEIFRSAWGLDSTSFPVTTTTIDILAKDQGHGFDVIKLDVEGSEEAALLGGLKTLDGAGRVDVFFEYSFGGPGRPLGAYSSDFWPFLLETFQTLFLVKPDGSRIAVKEAQDLAQGGSTNYAMVHGITKGEK